MTGVIVIASMPFATDQFKIASEKQVLSTRTTVYWPTFLVLAAVTACAVVAGVWISRRRSRSARAKG